LTARACRRANALSSRIRRAKAPLVAITSRTLMCNVALALYVVCFVVCFFLKKKKKKQKKLHAHCCRFF